MTVHYINHDCTLWDCCLQDLFLYKLAASYVRANGNYLLVKTNMDGSYMFDALFHQLEKKGKFEKFYTTYRFVRGHQNVCTLSTEYRLAHLMRYMYLLVFSGSGCRCVCFSPGNWHKTKPSETRHASRSRQSTGQAYLVCLAPSPLLATCSK